jgi:asparagine synthase (glutamine-hydrolysing)
MGGIAGIWQVDGQAIDRTTAERFIAAMAHRGPDAQGLLLDDSERLALAHRGRAPIDPNTAGDQPMVSIGGHYVITHDGNVYNSPELRTDLERVGFRFRTGTDAEVILAAYECWGPDCLLRFNGMWSFAIWDRQRRSLFVARDRFGVKPLYFLSDRHRFAFASELKAFLHLEGFKAVANTPTIAARLAENFDDGVLLRGIELLQPGHWLLVTPDVIKRERWWNLADHLITPSSDFSTQAEEFRELLFDACRLCLRGDGIKGTALSGGLDSAALLCSIAAIEKSGNREPEPKDSHRAYISAFPGTPQDETDHALLATRHAGMIPVVQALSSETFRDQVDAYLYQFEEIGGLFGGPAWSLYRQMRQDGVVASLDGHGADGLLGGFSIHVMHALRRGRGFATQPFRTLELIEAVQQMHDPGQPNPPPNKAIFAALTVPGVRKLIRRLPIARRGLGIAGLLLQPAPTSVARNDAERMMDALGPMTGALYRNFQGGFVQRALRNFDAHSMGHAVEVRVPFLDWRVVRYAFSVPDESKVAGGYAKRLLREAMRGIMPESLRLRRHKIGYNAPVANWLSHGLKDWLWDELNDAEFQRSELWDGPALLSLARAKRESHAPWDLAEAHRVGLAVTAHWWQTRWLRRSLPSPTFNDSTA